MSLILRPIDLLSFGMRAKKRLNQEFPGVGSASGPCFRGDNHISLAVTLIAEESRRACVREGCFGLVWQAFNSDQTKGMIRCFLCGDIVEDSVAGGSVTYMYDLVLRNNVVTFFA